MTVGPSPLIFISIANWCNVCKRYKYFNTCTMIALLIPHLENGWPYLIIAIICAIGVFHFRERLDK
jgi:hypothetical protein